MLPISPSWATSSNGTTAARRISKEAGHRKLAATAKAANATPANNNVASKRTATATLRAISAVSTATAYAGIVGGDAAWRSSFMSFTPYRRASRTRESVVCIVFTTHLDRAVP